MTTIDNVLKWQGLRAIAAAADAAGAAAADAATAAGTASTGVSDAATAQTAADGAQSTADIANAKAESALRATTSLTPGSQAAMPYVFAISPAPAPYDVEVACDTPSSTIHYQINGGGYSTYAGVISAPSGATLELYASASGLTDSAHLTYAVPA